MNGMAPATPIAGGTALNLAAGGGAGAAAGAAGAGFPWATMASIGIPMLLDLLMPKSAEQKAFEANLSRILATTREGSEYYTGLIKNFDPKITQALSNRMGFFENWGFPGGQAPAQPTPQIWSPTGGG